jgi:hypothetical protein
MNTEVPNNLKPEYIMDFQKFSQSRKGLIYSEDKVFIEGCFKEEGSDKIICGDNFSANAVHKSGEKINAEIIYKTYLEWFNYTLKIGEKPRVFVSAKFGEEENKILEVHNQ